MAPMRGEMVRSPAMDERLACMGAFWLSRTEANRLESLAATLSESLGDEVREGDVLRLIILRGLATLDAIPIMDGEIKRAMSGRKPITDHASGRSPIGR